MRRLSIALIAAASTIALTQMASAADLPRKAPPIMPAPVPDWSGVYVGLEGGYGWGHQNLDAVIPGAGCFDCPGAVLHDTISTLDGSPELFFPDVAVPSGKQKGWLFGGFAGAQKQWGSWVFGIEADFDGADIKESAISSAVSNIDVHTERGETPTHLSLTQTVAAASKIDELGSVRGKLGFVPAPDWLIYGTGGLAYAHLKNALTDTSSFTEVYDAKVVDSGSLSNIAAGGTSMFGWAAGAGVDWKFWHDAGSAWVLGVEYLHYGFGDQTVTFQTTSPSTLGKFLGTGGNTVAVTTTERVDTIKGRISYLFSIH
jgi:outer membrane immunogenic protein